ncbi:hypothetical protein Gotur_009936, partial [Gossypium turneri]
LREILENVCYPEIFLSFLTNKEKNWAGIQHFLNPCVRNYKRNYFSKDVN